MSAHCGIHRMVAVTETAHVELRNGRVKALAMDVLSGRSRA